MKKYIVYSFIIAGGMLFLIGTTVYADTPDDQSFEKGFKMHMRGGGEQLGLGERPYFGVECDEKGMRGEHLGVPGQFYEQRKSRIDDLLSNGTITQEEADKRLERLYQVQQYKLQSQADILGMTVNELKSELDSGKRFIDLAEEKGVTQDQIHERMQELRDQRRVQQAS